VACLWKGLVHHAAIRPAASYLERGSTDHLDGSTEKSSTCAIAPDLPEQNVLGNKSDVAQTKDDVGRREKIMTQIPSIKLGLIVICIATVTLSLAQTPRTGASGSNKASATIGTAAGHSGLSGNFSSAVQTGTNFRSGTSTTPNTNVGAHTGINGGPQTGISNQAVGIMSGAAAGGFGSSIGNSAGTTQIGRNARAGTNTTSTNAGAQTATAAAAAPARVTTSLPQLPVPIRSPLPNNSPVSSNFSTAGGSPSPPPSPSVTPTPTLTPAQLLGG